TQCSLQICQKVVPGNKRFDEAGHNGSAAKTATNPDAESDHAVLLHCLQSDIVHAHGGTIRVCAADCDLELAWQEGKFRMQHGPLADDLAPYQGIDEFVGSNTREVVGSSVANTVAAGLDGVHLHFCQFGQNGRNIFQPGPVELHVLACTEMTIAAIPATGNERYCTQLAGGEHAIRDCNTQHGSVALDIQPILQAYCTKFVFCEFTIQKTLRLVSELSNTLL